MQIKMNNKYKIYRLLSMNLRILLDLIIIIKLDTID